MEATLLTSLFIWTRFTFWMEWVLKRGKKDEVSLGRRRQLWTDTSGARCLPPRRSLQTNSGVAVLMNYLSFDVVSCGLVDATVISLVSTAAAPPCTRTNACPRLRVQPLPRARVAVRAVQTLLVCGVSYLYGPLPSCSTACPLLFSDGTPGCSVALR